MSRLYNVTEAEVMTAWKAVRQAGGGSGADNKKISDIEADLDNQLYKIWNRMSSGSYIPPAVLLVDIPKADGGRRQLGIPCVSDRIAQMVIKNRLEKTLEPLFHPDSYAYRPGKSAIDAVTLCRERCFRREWILDIDIQGFFDNLDHDILMQLLEKYTDDIAVLLYAKKWLKSPGQTQDGEKIAREKGTPQGGVVSPLLANLYLHEAFDKWMQEAFPHIWFERYADDIVVHCVSEQQAHYMRNRIEGRLRLFKLTLHPTKTRIVYGGTSGKHDKRGHDMPRKFTFLGYDFKPRMVRGRLWFTPGMGKGALVMIGQKIKEQWGLKHRLTGTLSEIAKDANPAIRGWIQYYGHHRRSDLYKLAMLIDEHLVRFLRKKFRSKNNPRQTWKQAWLRLKEHKKENPREFAHWHMISLSKR